MSKDRSSGKTAKESSLDEWELMSSDDLHSFFRDGLFYLYHSYHMYKRSELTSRPLTSEQRKNERTKDEK